MGEDRRATGEGTPNDRLRLTVPDAAHALGISPEAIRNRLSRGTLESERESGTVYVLIDRNMARYTDDTPGESAALISEMHARIESLEHQLEEANERDRENRRIIAALTSRIPAIEAPSETRESDVRSSPTGTPTEASTEAQEGVQRPWWRRVFGG